MAAVEVAPRPVDTSSADDDLVHVYCADHQLTWCGQDARNLPPVPDADSVSLDEVCRVCLAAYEMIGGFVGEDTACPVCGSAVCGES